MNKKIKFGKFGLVVAVASLINAIIFWFKGKKENNRKKKAFAIISLVASALDVFVEVESNFRPIEEDIDDEYIEGTFNSNSER